MCRLGFLPARDALAPTAATALFNGRDLYVLGSTETAEIITARRKAVA